MVGEDLLHKFLRQSGKLNQLPTLSLLESGKAESAALHWFAGVLGSQINCPTLESWETESIAQHLSPVRLNQPPND